MRMQLAIGALIIAGVMVRGGAKSPAPASEFAYDRAKAFDLKVEKTETRGGVTIQDASYAQLDGGRNRAYVVLPPGSASHPGILFVHWLEDDNPTSNRTEFLDEAVELASASGAVSVLPDTIWAVPGWFVKRNPATDYAASVTQTLELRRALDLLASRPGVDARRLVYVGHDFGAMYGALVAGLEPARLRGFVFVAGTKSFSDWFLLYPKVQGRTRQQVIDRLAPLDPTRFLAQCSPLPVLFQFGTQDQFVSKEAADALAASAGGPKDARFYEADHSMSAPPAVRADRLAWLKTHLRP